MGKVFYDSLGLKYSSTNKERIIHLYQKYCGLILEN